MIILAGGCGYLFMGSKITDASDNVTAGADGSKSLIVYFSRIGEIPGEPDAVSSATVSSNSEISGSDTEAAAQIIQQITGADMYQIMRPALAAKPENLDAYDTIYVGYPIWWFNAPMAIGSFLESYDFSGKTIVPFCTSQDNGIDVSMDYIRKNAKNAEVLDGHRIHNSDSAEIKTWLKEIGISISD